MLWHVEQLWCAVLLFLISDYGPIVIDQKATCAWVLHDELLLISLRLGVSRFEHMC